MSITPGTKIRKLSCGQINRIARFLEHDDWKKLMNEIQKDENHSGRFGVDDVRAIEEAGRLAQISCTDIFLQEWSTCSLNGQTPTVQMLREFLKKAKLYRAVAYIDTELLGDAPSVIAELPYRFLESITNGFSDSLEIGSGGFGTVYRGVLGRTAVAIKKFGLWEKEKEHFEQERIVLLNGLKHKNLLVPLAVATGDGLCSVYRFMPHGSLEDRLAMINPELSPLTWQKRVSIAMDVCEGLKYLHERPKQIVHRDIKPSNILLDENDDAKIADFGLIRIKSDKNTVITRIARGTEAYMSQDARSGRISANMDIYSFGMVLLQLLTSRPIRLRNKVHLMDYLMKEMNEDKDIKPFLDQTAGQWDMDVVSTLNDLAWACLHPLYKQRPDTLTVYFRLKEIYLRSISTCNYFV